MFVNGKRFRVEKHKGRWWVYDRQRRHTERFFVWENVWYYIDRILKREAEQVATNTRPSLYIVNNHH